jgi:hypothetical protein
MSTIIEYINLNNYLNGSDTTFSHRHNHRTFAFHSTTFVQYFPTLLLDIPKNNEMASPEETFPSMYLPDLPPLAIAGLTKLPDFLGQYSSATILRHCLGVEFIANAPPLLAHAIINCIDCESFEHDHSKVTEIGLAAFDSRDMRTVTPGPYGENLLKRVYYYHHRLIPNAHLVNTHFVHGDPTKNRFGWTRFVSIKEGKAAILNAFRWPIDRSRPELGLCPVIFVGHALQNDERMLIDALGINSALFGSVVRTIDTQSMTISAGLERPRRQIGLRTLCYEHGFDFRHSHTACNDAAYTLFNAVFMALRPEYFNDEYFGSVGKTVEEVVEAVAVDSQSRSYDSIGLAIYCERCGRQNHLRKDCRARVFCQRCKDAGRERAAWSHMTQNCSRSD